MALDAAGLRRADGHLNSWRDFQSSCGSASMSSNSRNGYSNPSGSSGTKLLHCLHQTFLYDMFLWKRLFQ